MTVPGREVSLTTADGVETIARAAIPLAATGLVEWRAEVNVGIWPSGGS
jgi:hypothetical protein